MKKVGLLINPFAKQARKNPNLVEKLTRHFPPSQCWIPQNLDELSQTTKHILDQGIEVLFIFGGDGTFRATIQELTKQNRPFPQIVVLQGGTINLFSRYYFGRKHPLAHVTQTLRKISEGASFSVTSINILQINKDYGFIFAIGGFSNFIKIYMENPDRSLKTALWIMFKLTLSFIFRTPFYNKVFSSFPVKIKPTHQPEINLSLTTLSCSTVPVIGLGFKPFTEIELNKFFSILLVQASPMALWLHVPALLRGSPIHSSQLKQDSAPSLEIFLSEPLQPMLDGDMMEAAKHLNVRLGPQIDLLI